ncbi:hypothetical protein, partial [Sutterella wadsworthensis]|uniref:hypothetical protein n=1 Tax=Sutterella wadsworthensis TaxID=40545 RepID=UPI003FF0B8D7
RLDQGKVQGHCHSRILSTVNELAFQTISGHLGKIGCLFEHERRPIDFIGFSLSANCRALR